MTADLHTTTSTADADTTAPLPTAPAQRRPEPGDASAPGPAHTPGGIPAVPVAVTAANSVVGGVSAAALAAGPAAALATVLGAGMLAAGTAAARRTTSRRAAGAGTGSTRPSPGRTGTRTAHGSGVGTGSGRRAPGSSGRTGTGTASAGTRSPTSGNRTGKTSPANGGGAKAGRLPGPRLASSAAGVRELRRQQATAAPTRAQRRQQQTAARREVADARRAAKAHRGGNGTVPGATSRPSRTRSAKALGHSSGSTSSPRARNTVAKSGGGRPGRRSLGQVVRSVPGTVRAAHRKRQDELADLRAKRAHKARMAASARRTLLRAMVRARLRYLARALPAAALALPLGLLGLLTTPLGRKLGWAWLMYPGRRLYAAMTAAHRARLAEDLAQARADADVGEEGEDDEIGDRVPRGRNTHTTTTEGTAMDDGQFGFAEAAAEMEAAAQKYDPETMMEVMAAIDSIPAGLQSIANIFALLVERSDAEYPMDPAVGEALADVHHLLTQAVTGAEEVCKTFGTAHEADIERLEAPRNGEEKWNYLGD
ncbi:hypothetical protein [Streptomyces sp. WMMC897]|uniref:hypothetical protein n=1 Tax=Streptomyces sp. WMMC897 TaxID=3014782 RepID=UPI0022B6FDB1|nr:hypothetical protein [Streptomyces sp. WMMC897]MCZ7417573.1 hypothetical protein [Streptomyces sp. WMMC897]